MMQKAFDKYPFLLGLIGSVLTVLLLFHGKSGLRNVILAAGAAIFLTCLYGFAIRRFGKFTRKAHASFADLILVGVFFCSLAGIMCMTNGSITISDNRNLAPLPYLLQPDNHINPQFTTQFDSWFSDHFGFRKKLVSISADMKVNYMGISNSENVTIGKNGWLFYSNPNDGNCVANYQNAQLYTSKDLEQIRESLTANESFLKSHEIKMILFMAPNKETIYGQGNLPGYNIVRSQSKTDQVIDYIRQNTDIPVVDPRADLLRQKASDVVYLKGDTHWNYLGGFIGYQALMNQIKINYPNVSIQQQNDFHISPQLNHGGDLVGMMGLDTYRYTSVDYLFAPKIPLKYDYHYLYNQESTNFTTTIDNPSLPSIYMLRDSFTNAMYPFLANDFRSAHFVWDSDFNKYKDQIASEHPDIFIYEFAERYVDRLKG